MGKTVAVLSEATLPPRSGSLGTMLVDLCENIHIHCREIRQEFSVAEFFDYVAEIVNMAADIQVYLNRNPEYQELLILDTVRNATGAPTVLSASPSPEQSAYYPNRLLVELIAPHAMGDVHLHYRDYRVQLTRTELRTLAAALQRAVNQLARVEARFPETEKPPKDPKQIARQCQENKSPPPGAGHFRALLKERDT